MLLLGKKSIIDLIIQSNTKSSMPLRARRRIEIAIAALCRCRRRDPFDQFLLFFLFSPEPAQSEWFNGCVVISNIKYMYSLYLCKFTFLYYNMLSLGNGLNIIVEFPENRACRISQRLSFSYLYSRLRLRNSISQRLSCSLLLYIFLSKR